MHSSRRICQLRTQFALLRSLHGNRQRCLQKPCIPLLSCCSTKTRNRSNSSTFLERQVLHFSTSTDLHTQTEVMKGEGDRKALNLGYEDILKAQKDDSVLIIDVREQDEINETGKLPGSIHIPMGDVVNLLTNLSDEAFAEKFEKPKPTKETKVILSCRSGRRSAVVQEEIQKLGYENSYNYTGGWLDWESNQKS